VEFVILEMREGSGYADTAHRYEFPRRYLGVFERVVPGEGVALIYEPRMNGGRQAYVAWATITSHPKQEAGGLYTVDLGQGLVSFDKPVPFAMGGSPIEHRLRSLERRQWGAALQGRAVRGIPRENALEILGLGYGHGVVALSWPAEEVAADLPERDRQLVSRLNRDARFRDGVLMAYDFRCAVTGLAAGPNPASKLYGLLEAAHVRPVSNQGPDQVANGISMTPTVHRLFDSGLFTLVPKGNEILIKRSPLLIPAMTTSPRGTRILIEEGFALQLPAEPERRPSAEFLDFHRREIFQSHAA